MATSFTLCLVALVVLSAAAASANIVNPGESGERCHHQIQGQRLNSCQRYLRDSSRCEESPARSEGGGWREEFPRCCEMLEQINEPCRCQAVKKVVEEVREGRQGGERRLEGREMEEMMKTAQTLPSLCRISSPRFCESVRGAFI